MGFFDNLGIGKKAQIEEWLNKSNIKKYYIRKDFSIDIYDENIYFVNTYQPLKFKINSCKNISFTGCELSNITSFLCDCKLLSIGWCFGITNINDILKINYESLSINNQNNINLKITDKSSNQLIFRNCNNISIDITNFNVHELIINKCEGTELKLNNLLLNNFYLINNNFQDYNITNIKCTILNIKDNNKIYTTDELHQKNIIYNIKK